MVVQNCACAETYTNSSMYWQPTICDLGKNTMLYAAPDRATQDLASSMHWQPAVCDLGNNTMLYAVPDRTTPDMAAQISGGECVAGTETYPQYQVRYGAKYDVGADTSPRYLDRVFATCDDVSQAMKGFRVNTENAGSDHGTIQASAMCTKNAKRTRNTKTLRTQYRPAHLGAVPHVADCDGKGLVGIGFETNPDDDDYLRMRYDCAYDIETYPKDSQTYYTGWSGDGQSLDSYDQHTVKCPNEDTVLTRVEYYKCPHTRSVTAKFVCAPFRPGQGISHDDDTYTAEPPTSPRAILTRNVSGDMNYERELAGVFSPIGENLKNSAIRIGDMATEVGKGLVKVGKGVGGMFSGVGNGFVDGGNAFVVKVKTAGQDVVQNDIGSIGNAFKSFPKVVKTRSDESVKQNLDPELDSVRNIGDDIKKSANEFKQNISKTFSGFFQAVPSAFKSFKEESKTCWKSVDRAWKI